MAIAAGAGMAAAQWGMSTMPEMRGVWNPVVGGGAVYAMDEGGRKQQIEFAVVGKEGVGGKDGYWMEFSMRSDRTNAAGKYLMVMDGENTRIQRMVIQVPGQGPMEMPMQMMGTRSNVIQPADIRKRAKDMGRDTITTPAGSFSCEHLQGNDGKWDAWVANQVTPYGLVKLVWKDGGTMTLVRVETNATDNITGTPRVFNPMGMGGRPQQ
jgi:hypothetical protein